MSFRIKNWSRFQHYKDRNPPWIKLHMEILASEDWVTLDDASKLLMLVCMMVAAKNDGCVPCNPEYIRRLSYISKRPDFKPLIACGFLVPLADACDLQADARPETETETETEKNTLSAFEEFWTAFGAPRNSKKPDAIKAWRSTAGRRPPLKELLRAVNGYNSWLAEQSRKQRREYPKQHPATWLRGEVWGNYLDGLEPLTPEQIAINLDRADKLMRRGKYAVEMG